MSAKLIHNYSTAMDPEIFGNSSEIFDNLLMHVVIGDKNNVTI